MVGGFGHISEEYHSRMRQTSAGKTEKTCSMPAPAFAFCFQDNVLIAQGGSKNAARHGKLTAQHIEGRSKGGNISKNTLQTFLGFLVVEAALSGSTSLHRPYLKSCIRPGEVIPMHEAIEGRVSSFSPHDSERSSMLSDSKRKSSWNSLLHHFMKQKNKNPNRLLYAWIGEKGNIEKKLSYLEVWEHANTVADYLRNNLGVKPGDRVVMCYLFSLDFIQAFLGCLIAGVVAVPIYPPSHARLEYSIRKMNFIIDDCQARHVLSHKDFTRHIWKLKLKVGTTWPNIPFVNTDSLDKDVKFVGKRFSRKSRGVMISYTNLLHNLQLLHINSQNENRDPDVEQISFRFSFVFRPHRTICWLPQYHDLGLIANYLLSLYAGGQGHFMSPIAFLKCPPMWMHSMWRYNCNVSFAPNFAYTLLVHKWSTVLVPKGFNLSHVRSIGAGGEENLKESFDGFEDLMGKYGMKRNTIHACYGMAEHVVGVSFDFNDPERAYSKVNPKQMCCAVFGDLSRSLGVKCSIVDPETSSQVEDGQEGEIWLNSESVALGYWNQPQKSKEVFGAELKGSNDLWLRTGDVGYMEGTRLYFVSRMKDVIIIRGRNIAPKDIEAPVDKVEGVRPGCTIAFSMKGGDGTEKLVVLSEVRGKKELRKLQRNYGVVAREIAYDHIKFKNQRSIAVRRSESVNVSEVVLIKERTIPKTSSGKLRRTEARRLYQSNLLQPLFKMATDNNSAKQPAVEEKSSSSMNPHVRIVNSLQISFATVMTKEDFEGALAKGLSTGFDWKDMGNDEFGTLVDSIQLVEIAGALRDSFGIMFQNDLILLRMTPNNLTQIVSSFCEMHAEMNGISDYWSRATQKLTRDPDSPNACMVTDETIDSLYNGTFDPAFSLQALSDTGRRSMTAIPLRVHHRPKKKPMDSQKRLASDSHETEFESKFTSLAHRENLSTWLRIVLQTIGVLSIFFLGSIAAIPAYSFSQEAIKRSEPWSSIAVGIYDEAQITGLLLIFIFPIWALSFSIITIVMKWLIIGRYKPGEHALHGWYWMRWWYIDSLFSMWELLVGAAIYDTIMFRFFYILCGAKITIAVDLKTFLREHDLICIGADSSVSGRLLARDMDADDGLVLAPIKIGKSCTISSNTVIGKGSILEDGCWIKVHTYVRPHTKIPRGTIWQGNRMRQLKSGNKGSRQYKPASPSDEHKKTFAENIETPTDEFNYDRDRESGHSTGTIQSAKLSARGGGGSPSNYEIQSEVGEYGANAGLQLQSNNNSLYLNKEISSKSDKKLEEAVPKFLASKNTNNNGRSLRHVDRKFQPSTPVHTRGERADTGDKTDDELNPKGVAMPKFDALVCKPEPSKIDLKLETCKMLTFVAQLWLATIFSSVGAISFWAVDLFEIRTNPEQAANNEALIDQRYFFLIFYTFQIVGSFVMLGLYSIVAKWILAGHVREGPYRKTLFTKWRRWYLALLQRFALKYFGFIVLGTKHSYYLIYQRLMGLSIGVGSLMPQPYNIHPEDAHLIEIGEYSFVSIGTIEPEFRCRSQNVRSRIRIGNGCTVGVQSHISGNVVMMNNSNISFLTSVEGLNSAKPLIVPEGTALLGTNRFKVSRSSQEKLHEYITKRQKNTLLFQTWFISMDMFLWVLRLATRYLCLLAAFEAGLEISGKIDVSGEAHTALFGVYFAIYFGCRIINMLFWKWVLVGRMREIILKPGDPRLLCSMHVQDEREAFESIFKVLHGSSLLNVFLCTLGAEVSLDAIITSTAVTDWDFLRIGKEAVIEGAFLGHIFDNFSMEFKNVEAGPGSKVGIGAHLSVPECSIGKRSYLAPLSKMLKKSIPSLQYWRGVPAQKSRTRR
eukprot:jgi/Bigna1/91948/estExt_fgenesh1_pg.C_1350004